MVTMRFFARKGLDFTRSIFYQIFSHKNFFNENQMTNLHVCYPIRQIAPDIHATNILSYIYVKQFITNVHQNIIIRMLLKNTLYDMQ